jgi:predicted dehydrogenase
MADPVRIGIIGCGSVMRRPYMSLIQDLRLKNQVEVVMACDVLEERRDFVRDKFGITNFSLNFRDVLESDQVDLVLILTSMQEHGPLTMAALEAGKHVLVEKPMSVDLAEAARIVELAKRSPGYLVCAPHVILSPTYRIMWQRIKRGDIGKVLSARACYGHGGPSWGPWFYRRGGGALFDLGVYNITSLTGFIGPARRVMAMTGIAIPERVVDGQRMQVEAEDNAHVLIDFGESVFAVVTTGFTMQEYRCPAIELYGSEGTIQMMGDDWDPDGYELWQNQVGAWQIFAETDPRWPWTDGLRHLVESIQQGVKPLITPEHAYHVLEIMLKAQESGADGQMKTIESTFGIPILE